MSYISNTRTCALIEFNNLKIHRLDLTDLVKRTGEPAEHQALARVVQANFVDPQVLARFVVSLCRNLRANVSRSTQTLDTNHSGFRSAVQKIGNQAISRDELHALIRSCLDPLALRFFFVNTPDRNADGESLINPFFYSAFIKQIEDPALFQISKAAFEGAKIDGKWNPVIQRFFDQACRINGQPVEERRYSPPAEDPSDDIASITFNSFEDFGQAGLARRIVEQCGNGQATYQVISKEDIEEWGFMRGAQEILRLNAVISRNVLHGLIERCEDAEALLVFLNTVPEETVGGQFLRNTYFYRMFIKAIKDPALFEVSEVALRMAKKNGQYKRELGSTYQRVCKINQN